MERRLSIWKPLLAAAAYLVGLAFLPTANAQQCIN